jgi:hypothetical protein
MEGVYFDICLIDTVHCNPGEFINILEVLPYMKKNAIIILHDTNLHMMEYDVLAISGITDGGKQITNHIILSTLKGKYIRPINTGRSPVIPNIGAIILDNDVENMLYPLFANFTLPWEYIIPIDDYKELLIYFNNHYPSSLVKIFIESYKFYSNKPNIKPYMMRQIPNEPKLIPEKSNAPQAITQTALTNAVITAIYPNLLQRLVLQTFRLFYRLTLKREVYRHFRHRNVDFISKPYLYPSKILRQILRVFGPIPPCS